jgi:hypothetical protein
VALALLAAIVPAFVSAAASDGVAMVRRSLPAKEQLRRQEFEMFELAETMANERGVPFAPLASAHLIRFPKSGSSLLSSVVRRLVGCNPPGPCCYYPGNPPGSCPATSDPPWTKALECKRIVGCVGHSPHLHLLFNSSSSTTSSGGGGSHSVTGGSLFSISMMREPISRAISVFSYAPPHTSRVGACSDSFSRSCFLRFVDEPRFSNVVAKTFSGNPAYHCPGANCSTKEPAWAAPEFGGGRSSAQQYGDDGADSNSSSSGGGGKRHHHRSGSKRPHHHHHHHHHGGDKRFGVVDHSTCACSLQAARRTLERLDFRGDGAVGRLHPCAL